MMKKQHENPFEGLLDSFTDEQLYESSTQSRERFARLDAVLAMSHIRLLGALRALPQRMNAVHALLEARYSDIRHQLSDDSAHETPDSPTNAPLRSAYESMYRRAVGDALAHVINPRTIAEMIDSIMLDIDVPHAITSGIRSELVERFISKGGMFRAALAAQMLKADTRYGSRTSSEATPDEREQLEDTAKELLSSFACSIVHETRNYLAQKESNGSYISGDISRAKLVASSLEAVIPSIIDRAGESGRIIMGGEESEHNIVPFHRKDHVTRETHGESFWQSRQALSLGKKIINIDLTQPMLRMYRKQPMWLVQLFSVRKPFGPNLPDAALDKARMNESGGVIINTPGWVLDAGVSGNVLKIEVKESESGIMRVSRHVLGGVRRNFDRYLRGQKR